MASSTDHPADADGDASTGSPFPYPFNRLEARYIVTVSNRPGLHEVLEQAPDGKWIVRALNERDLKLVYVAPEELRGFELPIFHCYASRDRRLIVAFVNGDEYDVTREDVPEAEQPLFQEAHPLGLSAFAELAASAGFSSIELTNGYHAWQGKLDELIDQRRLHSTAIEPPAG